MIAPAGAVVALAEGVVQPAAEIHYSRLRMRVQIVLYLAAEIILPLRDLQRAEKAGNGFHPFALLGKIIVQRVADPLRLRVGKQLRKMLGAHQPPEQRDDQRLLHGVFLDVVFHACPLGFPVSLGRFSVCSFKLAFANSESKRKAQFRASRAARIFVVTRS